MDTPTEGADRLLALLARGADHDYIGEEVSQLEHARQAAARALRAGAPDAQILAALFHDLGHLVAPANAPTLDGFGIADHEAIGADALAAHGCARDVTEPVREHVRAKRYLCWRAPRYHERLSAASRETLARQGGPMSDAEAAAFGARPDLAAVLAVRAWDDQAKDPLADAPTLDSYRDLLVRYLDRSQPMLDITLTEPDLAAWRRDHYLVLRNPLAPDQIERLRGWTDEVTSWPETPGKWMKYFETSASGARQLCRIEDFVPYHPGLRELLCGDGIMRVLAQLMDEPAVLFKEKINLKLPGGAGFTAHQDAPAFVTFGHRYHITVAVAIDAATIANGCLELSDPVAVYETLPQAAGGSIEPAVEARLPWRPLELAPGDVVFFDSYLPHRSKANTSETSRRALYVTYNRLSEGARRDEYFAHKRAHFPPECERVPGVDYGASAAIYNLGNPIR